MHEGEGIPVPQVGVDQVLELDPAVHSRVGKDLVQAIAQGAGRYVVLFTDAFVILLVDDGFDDPHIQLIALGGAIGTGLFYGSSESIQLAGPSILLAYLVGGLAIFMIVRALSEMAVEDPKAGAFSYYATRYWSRRAGFISGWNYWFNYVLVAMVELAVVGSFVNYWFPNIPKWVSAAVFLVAIAALNLMGVNKFGEFEFWFAIIKIVAVLAMILGGLYVVIANVPTASGIRASFANWFTVDGGFLPHGLMTRNADGTPRIRAPPFRRPRTASSGVSSSSTSARSV